MLCREIIGVIKIKRMYLTRFYTRFTYATVNTKFLLGLCNGLVTMGQRKKIIIMNFFQTRLRLNRAVHMMTSPNENIPRHWPFMRGIQRSPMNSPHKGQWRGALMFSQICAWTNGWANSRDAGDMRRHYTRYDVTIMKQEPIKPCSSGWNLVISDIQNNCD